jgi:CBS domain containing-hemolysin-like protein
MQSFADFGLVILALAFVLLNGFFVAAEFAMVKLRATQVHTLEDTRGWRGRILAKVHQHLDAYLSACQLGITLASLGLGWLGEPAFAGLIRPILETVGVTSPSVVEFVTIAVAFAIISFLHIVVGELMPKSMAIRQAEAMSLWTAIPLYMFYWLMYPAIYLLNLSANTLLRWFNLDAVHNAEGAYTTEEIKLILKSSHMHGDLTSTEAKMLKHTLDFADLEVTDVMRPSAELIALDINAPLKENLDIIVLNRYSRYPVYQGEFDQMIGIIHTKDLFALSQKSPEGMDLQKLLRPVLKLGPESSVLDIFQRFRKGAPHLALIYRRGRVVGFLTLDNLLQVLIGKIKDEFHLTNEDWQKTADGAFMVKGHASIYVLEQLLDKDLSEDYDVSTISGLILQQLGHFPKKGEEIPFDDFKLIVEKIQGPRIEEVKVVPLTKVDEE